MRLLAIDPGNTQTAWIILDNGTPDGHAITPNTELLEMLGGFSCVSSVDEIAIEYFQPRGMPTSAQEMDTIFWSGRLIEAAKKTWHRVSRMEEKMKVCGSAKAKDGNIRASLIDLYGGESAIGKKANPGPLYGISKDVWQALAVGVTHLRKAHGDLWRPPL